MQTLIFNLYKGYVLTNIRRMIIGMTFVIVFVLIIGLLLYSKTKSFREYRERKLIYSTQFQNLKRIGFKTKRVDSKTVYHGKLNDYYFVIFIDSNDVMAFNNFSLVFSVTYSKIDEATFKYLNHEYYNRVKSLLINTEYIFFDWEFAQFRYTNNLMKISINKINSKLNQILDILKKEKLKPNELTDIRALISRGYE